MRHSANAIKLSRENSFRNDSISLYLHYLFTFMAARENNRRDAKNAEFFSFNFSSGPLRLCGGIDLGKYIVFGTG